MPDEVIEYKSKGATTPYEKMDVMETSTTKGLKCVWSGVMTEDIVRYSWKFDWDELKKDGVDGLTGRIVFHWDTDPMKYRKKFSGTIGVDVDLNETNNVVEGEVDGPFKYDVECKFELTLNVHRLPTQTFHALPTKNDTVLVIGKKEINVNKAFLSSHSDYFRDLFSSNNKGKHANKYTLRDVSSDDLELLLSTLHTKIVIPNDATAIKLLELGDRFKMNSHIPQIEHFLKCNSKMSNEKMLEMADKYGLSDLLEECINRMNTIQKADDLKRKGQYLNFSVETRAKLFNRLMQIIKVPIDRDSDFDDDDF